MRSAFADTLQRHLGLAVPGILGARRVLATQDWHCQELLASRSFLPLIVGSARDYWRLAGSGHSSLAVPGLSGGSHPGLALPGIVGVGRAFAAQDWQCQGLLAPGSFSPPSVGTARDLWRAEGFHHPAPDIKKLPCGSFQVYLVDRRGFEPRTLGLRVPCSAS